MTISFQQLRSAIPGAQPSQLDPGQVAFNVSDGTMYLGTGSDTRIDFSGTVVTPNPPAGKGWVQVLLERTALNDFFIANPEAEGRPAPTNEQVLTYNAALGVAEWQDAGTGFAYSTDNAAVAAAPGSTTSQKISFAIGSPSYIGQSATCIVQGGPGTTYEGLYIWSGTQWLFAAHYAFNTAAQVPATNPMTSLASDTQTVLTALKNVDDNLQAQITTNDGDIATLQGQMATAQTDINDLQINKLDIAQNDPVTDYILSYDGTGQLWIENSAGDVTGVNATSPITVDNTDPQQPTIGINGASTVGPGAVQLSDSVSSTSSLQASTPFATKTAYDAAVAAQDTADAAIPRASYTAQGDLLVGTGAGTFGALGVGTQGQILVVGPGGSVQWEDDAPGDVTSVAATAPITVDNTDPEVPVIGVNLATTATPGVVQVELTGNLTLVAGVINVPDASTTVKGAVSLNNTLSSSSTTQALTAAQGAVLQGQIDALTIAANTTLAGGWDALNGVVDGVTAAGLAAGFVNGDPLPPADASNEDYYLVCVVSGSNPSAMENGDWLLSDGTNWLVLGVGARPPQATYNQQGIVQLADANAVLAGTSDTTAITPQALQDNVIDAVNVSNSSQIASATAVKTAYDAGVQGQTDAAAALAVANAALPKAGGTMTGTLTGQNVNVQATYALQFAGGTNGSLSAVTNLTNVTSSTTAASATAVKAAYDAGVQGQTDAAAAQSDADQALLDAAAAQATADAAIPDATFTTAGQLLYGTGAGTYSVLPIGTNGQSLIVSAGAIVWGASLQGYTNTATPFNTALGANAGDSITTAVNNTAIGYNAGTANLTGNNNTFVGFAAGDATTSDNNTALGSNALGGGGVNNNTALGANTGCSLTTGSSNTFVGASAGDNATTADNSVAVGFNALGGVATAAGSVALGVNALAAVTSAAGNVAVGLNTGCALTTGGCNVYIGCAAGDGATTASLNVGVGAGALGSALTTNGHTAIGYNALAQLTNGTCNTAVGFGAGTSVTGGGGNTFVGYSAGDAVTSGSNNTFVGRDAGSNTSVGNANVFIGYNAGSVVTTGFGNSIIGSYAGTTTLSNNVVLSDGSANIKLQINENGAVGVGTAPSYGTAGQVLTSGGSGAAPTWTTPQIGDITAVTAGTGLTGGGTSGDVTLTLADTAVVAASYTAANVTVDAQGRITAASNGSVIAPSLLTTTGDIIIASAADTPARLGIGTAGQILTVVGGLPAWAAPATPLSGYTNTATPFNTALGALAGDSITTGVNNTAIGYNSGTSVTGGLNNTFVGFNSGDGITSADNNTAVGSNALSNTGGNNNTAIGYLTGAALTSGGSNTFVGAVAGDGATTADFSTAVGYNALGAAHTANGTVAVGANALAANTSGAGNTAVGFNAGAAITTGSNNTILGLNAGDTVTTGTQNTFVGSGSGGLAATTVEGSTAVGYNALGTGVTSGAYNTALGNNAGASVTSGALNTFVGFSAGSAVTTGGSNTIIGRYAGNAALSNNVVLSDGAGTVRFQANSTGAWSPNGVNFGTAGQVLTSAGTGAAPSWSTLSVPASYTDTFATVSATPINLLSFAGAVRMGTLTVMLTDNATNVAWANVTIASDSGAGSSVVTTSGGTFGTFSITTNVGNDTIVTFTPSSTLASVNAVYKYDASFGSQPTVL